MPPLPPSSVGGRFFLDEVLRAFHTGRSGEVVVVAMGLVRGGLAPLTRCAASTPEGVTEFGRGA